MNLQQRYLVIGGLVTLAVLLHIMFWTWGYGNQVVFAFFTDEVANNYGVAKTVRWGLSPRVVISSSDVFVADILGIALPVILLFSAGFFYLKHPKR